MYICRDYEKKTDDGGYFEAFIATLPEKVVRKIDYGLTLLRTQNRLSEKHIKHIGDGLFELRTEFEGNIYRTFFIYDSGNVIVLFNGFQKKTQKTPRLEVLKAKKIMYSYYEKTRR